MDNNLRKFFSLLILLPLLFYQHMEILIHMLAARHSTQLAREYATFTTPFLAIFIEDIWVEFKRSRKKATFSWDERLVDIVLPPRMKEIDDIHTVYTPMIWNDSHWVVCEPKFALSIYVIGGKSRNPKFP